VFGTLYVEPAPPDAGTVVYLAYVAKAPVAGAAPERCGASSCSNRSLTARTSLAARDKAYRENCLMMLTVGSADGRAGCARAS
jgi:hypothetical protein